MSNNAVKTNKIAIIGSGAFACGIYSTMQDVKDNDISIYFHDAECLNYVIQNKRHPKMPCSFDEKTKLTNNFEEAVNDKEIIFLCCTFSSAKDVINNLKNCIGARKKIDVVICCKGVLQEEPFFLCDYVKNELNNANTFVLSGGSFADEMCKKQETIVNIACDNVNNFNRIAPIFDDFFKVKYCNNPQAVEFLGAIKNVMAIYTGFCYEKNKSANATIKGIVDFIDDIKNLFKQLNFDEKILLEPAGIGDIMLTCLFGKSRNKTFGELLATNIKQAKEYQQNTTIEGFDAIFAIQNFCKLKNLKQKTLEFFVKMIEGL